VYVSGACVRVYGGDGKARSTINVPTKIAQKMDAVKLYK